MYLSGLSDDVYILQDLYILTQLHTLKLGLIKKTGCTRAGSLELSVGGMDKLLCVLCLFFSTSFLYSLSLQISYEW